MNEASSRGTDATIVTSSRSKARPVFVDDSGRRGTVVRSVTALALIATVVALCSVLAAVARPSTSRAHRERDTITGTIASSCAGSLRWTVDIQLLRAGEVLATTTQAGPGTFEILAPPRTDSLSIRVLANVPIDAKTVDGTPTQVTAADGQPLLCQAD